MIAAPRIVLRRLLLVVLVAWVGADVGGTAPDLHSLGAEDSRTGDARAPEILGRLDKTPE